MKYYTLYGFINSKDFKVNKKFKTRNEAINYATYRLLPINYQVETEVERGKHVIEYICGNRTSFIISRQVA